MRKKRVLFVNHSLHSGGVEKSLVTILHLFDYERYDVDLQLFLHRGLFLDNLPKEVNLLPPLLPEEYGLPIRRAFLKLMRRSPVLALRRLFVTLTTHSGSLGDRLAWVYRIEHGMLRPNPTRYDAVVAFMEGEPLYYAVDKTVADQKIAFIHGDYTAMGLNRAYDARFIDRLDALCTVSNGCKETLDRVFPQSAARHYVIQNILSARLLQACAETGDGFSDRFDGKRILTIARLSHQKGLDVGIDAVAQIRDLPFRWYILGVGPLEAALREQAKARGVAEKIVFLGETPNPYPYLAACDVYFQPSRFEGKSIAVDEACLFKKPMLLAAYSTAGDQIEADAEGLIRPLAPDALAAGLRALLTDSALCARLSARLAQKAVTNESELQKLYALLEKTPS